MPTDAYHDDIDAFLRLWGEPNAAELRLWVAALAPLGDHTADVLATWVRQSERKPHPHALLVIRAQTAQTDRMQQIALDVAHGYGMSLDDICSAKRQSEIAIPRQHVMHALRAAGYSTTRIGRFLRRDHTTVIAGAKAHAARVNARQI